MRQVFARIIAFIVMPSIFTTISYSASYSAGFKIRGVSWGISKADLQKVEMPNNLLASSETHLRYKDTLFGYSTKVDYVFQRDQLVCLLYKTKVPNFSAKSFRMQVDTAFRENQYKHLRNWFHISYFQPKNTATEVMVFKENHSNEHYTEFYIVYSLGDFKALQVDFLGSVRESIEAIQKKQVLEDSKKKL